MSSQSDIFEDNISSTLSDDSDTKSNGSMS